jgi:hypothetical protein
MDTACPRKRVTQILREGKNNEDQYCIARAYVNTRFVCKTVFSLYKQVVGL